MANKTDQILADLGGNINESMGEGRTPGRLHSATVPVPPSSDPKRQGVTRSSNAVEIRLDRIVRDANQPREEFDAEALQRLADSMKTRGQLQPIRVRWDESRGAYVIVCGERRWRAAAMAGMTTIACVIHEGDIDLLAVQLIENALREDLKPIEQARAFKALIDGNGWDYRRLAAELSITGATVTRCLSLLDLPAGVQEQVEQGVLLPSVAYEVSKIADPDEQVEVARAVVEEKLTRGETAELVRAVKARRPAPAQKPEPVAYDLGDYTVTVRWKRPSPVTAAEALKQAAKMERDRGPGRERVA